MSSSDFELQKLIELIALPAPKNCNFEWLAWQYPIIFVEVFTSQALYMYLAMLSLLVEIYCFVHDSQQCKRFVTFNGYYLYTYLIIFDSMYLPALIFVFLFLKKNTGWNWLLFQCIRSAGKVCKFEWFLLCQCKSLYLYFVKNDFWHAFFCNCILLEK